MTRHKYDDRTPAEKFTMSLIEGCLEAIYAMEKKIMSKLEDLVAQVHTNTTVVQSAITLINGISDRIKAAGTDPDALAALTDELDQQDQLLGAAVAANTVAQPVPTPPVAPADPVPGPATPVATDAPAIDPTTPAVPVDPAASAAL